MSESVGRTIESDETPATGAPTPAPVQVTVSAGRVYWWCACGNSRQQPFCDGSHKGTEFTPLRYQASEAGAQWFCVCKRTQTPPFCDGSHTACAKDSAES